MFDGCFIHFYANYSQRNHFGVFLVMQFDRDCKPIMESSSGNVYRARLFGAQIIDISGRDSRQVRKLNDYISSI